MKKFTEYLWAVLVFILLLGAVNLIGRVSSHGGISDVALAVLVGCAMISLTIWWAVKAVVPFRNTIHLSRWNGDIFAGNGTFTVMADAGGEDK